MKTSCLFLPLIPAAALAACGSPTTASVQIDPDAGWSGTAEVLVHTPTGTMSSRTPITSTAEVSVNDGDTVTVVLHDAGKVALFSMAGVKQGDSIELPIGPLGAGQVTSANVTLPTVSGATNWDVSTPTSSASGDNSAGFSIDLPAGTKNTPILATAESDTGVLAMFGEKNAAVTGGAISITDSVPFQSVPITLQNAPAGGFSFAGGDAVIGDKQLSLVSTNNTVAVPTGFGDSVTLLAASLGQTELDLTGASYAAAPSGTVSFDLALPELPAISALTIANGTAKWTLTGGSAYTLVAVDVAASSNDNFQWSIMAPPATASLTLPQLPSDLSAPTTFDNLGVGVLLRSDVGSYSDALHELTGPTPAGAHISERFVNLPSGNAAASHAARALELRRSMHGMR